MTSEQPQDMGGVLCGSSGAGGRISGPSMAQTQRRILIRPTKIQEKLFGTYQKIVPVDPPKKRSRKQ